LIPERLAASRSPRPRSRRFSWVVVAGGIRAASRGMLIGAVERLIDFVTAQ
jgi:hypothetical protein